MPSLIYNNLYLTTQIKREEKRNCTLHTHTVRELHHAACSRSNVDKKKILSRRGSVFTTPIFIIVVIASHICDTPSPRGNVYAKWKHKKKSRKKNWNQLNWNCKCRLNGAQHGQVTTADARSSCFFFCISVHNCDKMVQTNRTTILNVCVDFGWILVGCRRSVILIFDKYALHNTEYHSFPWCASNVNVQLISLLPNSFKF